MIKPIVYNTIYDPVTHQRMPFQFTGGNVYMSGRWRRRDGDTYGNIAPQPPIELAEPDSADDTPGHLRPPAKR